MKASQSNDGACLNSVSTRAQALNWAKVYLAQATQPTDTPLLDAQLLLCKVLSISKASLFAWTDEPLSERQSKDFEALITQRFEGAPVAHLLGEQGFWSLDLNVDASTLIPRPETELLVEAVLELDLPAEALVIDLGTGTGAIALALASERPRWNLVGIDKSAEAVLLARTNAIKNNLSKVRFETGDWANAWQKNAHKPIHCIVSNPPYIDPSDPHLKQGDVRFEPLSALISDKQGMADIEIIAAQATTLLADQGWLAFEHGYDQGAAVAELLVSLGFNSVTTLKDYNDQDRVTFGKWLDQ